MTVKEEYEMFSAVWKLRLSRKYDRLKEGDSDGEEISKERC